MAGSSGRGRGAGGRSGSAPGRRGRRRRRRDRSSRLDVPMPAWIAAGRSGRLQNSQRPSTRSGTSSGGGRSNRVARARGDQRSSSARCGSGLRVPRHASPRRGSGAPPPGGRAPASRHCGEVHRPLEGPNIRQHALGGDLMAPEKTALAGRQWAGSAPRSATRRPTRPAGAGAPTSQVGRLRGSPFSSRQAARR